jgi:hypothetical protein
MITIFGGVGLFIPKDVYVVMRDRERGVVRILDKAWSSFVKIELLPKFGYAKICPKYTLDKVSEVIDRNN